MSRDASRALYLSCISIPAAGYVGVVTHRWRKRYRENRQRKESGEFDHVIQVLCEVVVLLVGRSPLALLSSGMALGVVAMATGPALRRWGSPRPDHVFASVLPMLRSNNEVRERVLTLSLSHLTSCFLRYET